MYLGKLKLAQQMKLFFVAVLSSISVNVYASLPESMRQNLEDLGLNTEDIAIVIMDAGFNGKTLVTHNEKTMMNPASVMKLVTTYAALDMLGPSYMWNTAVFVDGQVKSGVLHGSLYIRGSGDPSLTTDRMRDLLLQVRAAGIQEIQGNLIIDRSAFDIPVIDPAAFDGEGLRPYNARPDSLLLNYKTITFSFNPAFAEAGGSIPVLMTPAMTGVNHPLTVKVSGVRCGDWRAALKADFKNPLDIKFNGSFPLNCGPKQWYVAFPEPESYALRSIDEIWQSVGGTLTGNLSFGVVPAKAKLVAYSESKSLTEIVRDVNKFSNNVMAQSVFLALSLPDQKSFLSAAPISTPATYEQSRAIVAQWWKNNFPQATAPVMENGSGLSRFESISAQSLAVMLQKAWGSAVMSEFMSSLPIASVDGTMTRSKTEAAAHIKTGSMRNVTTRAGYVLASKGQRRIFVFMINSNKLNGVGEAVDALIDWTAEQ